MKFLIDAQLPRRLVFVFRNAGYDAIHTLDLPQQNTTSDSDITNIAIQETRIVVTKDADFVESFILSRRPPRLLVIATGNIRNIDDVETIATNASIREIERLRKIYGKARWRKRKGSATIVLEDGTMHRAEVH
ncbi:DUF5615 family PIN-like protein [Candidatus Chloroploca asiatica]|uniref:DUF5615 domain-containing protein n=1 Tax=Candidatus Chloroploca asiatica TaxID=1506545 RepID=A0A2H3KRP7_9CHLR|nr:DUF5615 family PIN-like protein [Candidatus Chloroploca asiatica]PDV96492.1 hypothetical protein A9Q02_22710 [Candidatus Chloroploca asiatica]